MTKTAEFHFVFRKGAADKAPLLLLHGTGGNEHDLVDIADMVAPGRTLLSPRGRVNEHGMNRFFRRFAEGVLDEDDIRQRAEELRSFVLRQQQEHALGKFVALGFSNGANMAAALLALYPDLLAGAVLLRAMAPFKAMPAAQLSSVPVLLTSGTQDQMIPRADANRLGGWLKASGADLAQESWPTGHGLVQNDITAMTTFIASKAK
jgi:phospholipase/carboxylesterase